MLNLRFIRNYKNYTYLLNKQNTIIVVINNENTIIRQSILKKQCDVHFDPNTATINLKTNVIDHYNKNRLFQYNYKLSNIYKGFFKKIKFAGKGFRLTSYKRKRIIEFIFGHSHIYLLFIKSVFYKRYNKYKYILYSKNAQILKNVSREISRVKKLNLYTLRGLRETKTVVVKRKGRKSPNL
jgi:ribosomal protein L6P/L9E